MTKLIRRTRRPLSEPVSLLPEFDQMMAGFFRPVWDLQTRSGGWMPAVDVQETDNAFLVEAELPGLGKDDVNVTFEDGVLTLTGERKFEEETEEKNYRRVERRYGSFSRSFNLGRQVDAEAVDASFKDGLLTITVPKTEAVKPRSIEIH